MLEEYSHYVFSFHDQFVEAIAAGIWFEVDDALLSDRDLDTSHPLRGLAHLEVAEQFESSGITCFVRKNPLAVDEIERAARLCSQTLLEIGAELEGRSSTSWFLTRRVKNGTGRRTCEAISVICGSLQHHSVAIRDSASNRSMAFRGSGTSATDGERLKSTGEQSGDGAAGNAEFQIMSSGGGPLPRPFA